MSVNNLNKVVNFQLVSLNIVALAGKYFFPNLPNLEGAIITKIETYPALVLAKDTEGRANVSTAVFESGYLTLRKGSDDVIKEMPLPFMQCVSANGTFVNNEGSLLLANLEFDFTKSYVQFPITTSQPNATDTVLFGVYYIKK